MIFNEVMQAENMPISLAEAAEYLVDVTEDAALAALVRQTVMLAESFIGGPLISRQFTATADTFSSKTIVITKQPVRSIDSIKYYDADGVQQTISAADYHVVLGNHLHPARIVPAVGKSWPSTWTLPGAVLITFTAGWGTTWNDVPEDLRAAVLRMMAHFHEHRGDDDADTLTGDMTLPATARQMLLYYRVTPQL